MTTIKHEIRIPTTQYGYISIFLEGVTAEEAIEEHNQAVKLYEMSKSEKPGLSVRDFARVKRNLLNGVIEDNIDDYENMNKAQSWFIKELSNTLKQIKNQE